MYYIYKEAVLLLYGSFVQKVPKCLWYLTLGDWDTRAKNRRGGLFFSYVTLEISTQSIT